MSTPPRCSAVEVVLVAKKARRKERPSARRTTGTIPRQLVSQLAQAQSLIEAKRWSEARELLGSLARRYPGQESVLATLVNLYYDTQDLRGYLGACERLARLTPNDPEVTLALAGAHLVNIHPASAARTFQRFLERWPDHPAAARAREELAGLHARLPELLGQLNLEGDDALELAAMHEEVQTLLELGSYREARTLAERVLRRAPRFVGVLNNLS